MEIYTTFKKESKNIADYQSVVVAIEKFSIAHDHALTNIELIQLSMAAKASNTKINVLLNKMIFDEDVKDLKKTLEFLKSLAVDGILFSDMAVFMLARDLGIEHLLIYAPGMTVVNSLDVKEYLDLNIQAVELANEITLEEKIEIAKNNPGKVGIVISGYLLMSFSKRLALSNYFEEINKDVDVFNNYNLKLKEATRDGLMPTYQSSEGTYIYSEYILDSFKYIKDLMSVDFKYFRIDGIFLSQPIIKDLYDAYSKQVKDLDLSGLSLTIKNKYPELTFNDIFYTTKTSEVK